MWGTRAGRLLASGVAVAVLAVSGLSSAAVAPPTVPGTTCQVFPSNNVWNSDISNLPVNPNSATWLSTMGAATTNLHPDFGPPKDYGIPYDVVSSAHALMPLKFLYADESDPGPYPFGSDIHIEGSSDHHAIMVNKDTCTLYELFAARLKGKRATADSGAIFNLNSNAQRPETWTSADAAGLAIYPGLLQYNEVQAGSVNHAIRFTVSCTVRSYVWPATHQAGQTANPNCPPMGARFRLKAGFDISHYSPQAQAILTAMKHYGVILADNGSNFFFQGAVNPAWSPSLIAELKTVPGNQFEAVDESGCRAATGSYQFTYNASTCPAPA